MPNKYTYNPQIHHRRSIRLKGYDYSREGMYFITICCQNRVCRFGEIENDKIILNEFGIIVHNEWEKLPNRFPNIDLDVFQIMPNHLHGILVLNDDPVGARFTRAQNGNVGAQNEIEKGQPQGIAPTRVTVGNIVGAYKSLAANGCLEIYKSKNEIMGKLWQRNYHEHIVRNERSYQTISEYIMNNPANWQNDKFYQ